MRTRDFKTFSTAINAHKILIPYFPKQLELNHPILCPDFYTFNIKVISISRQFIIISLFLLICSIDKIFERCFRFRNFTFSLTNERNHKYYLQSEYLELMVDFCSNSLFVFLHFLSISTILWHSRLIYLVCFSDFMRIVYIPSFSLLFIDNSLCIFFV